MMMTRYMFISLNWLTDDCKTGKAFCKIDSCRMPFKVLQEWGGVRFSYIIVRF